MSEPEQRCDCCGGLVNVLSSDYNDRCLNCRIGGMVPFAEASR